MMVGLVRPDGGRVLLDDEDITRLPMYKRARQGMGYLAQEASAFRKLTTAENIMLVLEMQPGLSRSQRLDKRDQLLSSLGLTPARPTAQTLSGGERRRVEIARVLATRPAFILLDEPFTGIDPIHREELQEIIAGLKRQNIGVLITDHSELATLQITDRAYIISEGQIKTSGRPWNSPTTPSPRSTTSARVRRIDPHRHRASRSLAMRGYFCAICGELFSPEEATEAGFQHEADGGRLMPIRP